VIPLGISRDKIGAAIRAVKRGEDATSWAEPLLNLPEVDQGNLHALKENLEELIQEYPETIRQRSEHAQKFDGEANILIHQSLSLPPQLPAADDFWRGLAVLYLNRIVDWRHGQGGGAKEANFGAGSPWDNLPRRLWMRAEIVMDTDRRDPYELARRGGGDFWRSHIIRIRYGSCRSVARAFVDLAYPYPGRPRKSVWTRDELREMPKRLRRLQATVALELLDESAARTLISGELEKIRSAADEPYNSAISP
jgi:hypothetical protein